LGQIPNGEGCGEVHLLLDHDGLLPGFAIITAGKASDIRTAHKFSFPKGSIAATGSSPPYAVRFLPVKLYFVAALILLGSRDCSPRACSAASALTWSKSVFTNWIAPFPAAPRRRPHGVPPFYPNIGRLAKATPTQTLSQFKPSGTRRVHNLGVSSENQSSG